MRVSLVVAGLALLAGGVWGWLVLGRPATECVRDDVEEARRDPPADAPPPSLAPSPARAASGAGRAPADRGSAARDPGDASVPGAEDPRLVGRLEGVVVDEQGVPVPGARVRARILDAEGHGGPGSAGHLGRALCGPDGRFALRSLLPGVEYQLEAEGPSHASGTAGPFRAEVGATPSVELRLPASRFVDVVVRDAGSGAPIEGASFTGVPEPFRPEGVEEALAPATDVSGRLRVGPVLAEAVTIGIRADGYLDASRTIPPGVSDAIEVYLAKGLSLSGRVLRPDGSPAVGAAVKLRMGPDAFAVLHTAGWLDTTTDATGSFSFSGLPRVRVPLEARLQPPGVEGRAPPAEEVGTAAPDAGTTDCVIRLGGSGDPRLSAVTLRVVDPDGRPVPRARISIDGRGWSLSTGLSGGCFVHDRPSAANDSVWRVTITQPTDAEGGPLPLASAGVDVTTTETEVTIRLERSDPIRGVVRGPDGAPVAEATVSLATGPDPEQMRDVASVTTSSDGTFSLLGAAREPCRISVSPPRGFLAPDPLDARAGATGLEIRLRAGVTAVVTVLDAEGAPRPGAQVVALGEGGTPPLRAFRGDAAASETTDAAGRATLVGLDAAQRYGLLVTSRSPAWRDARTAAWSPADTTVRLERALRIAGVVRDPAGRPVPAARVVLRQSHGSREVGADARGRFTIEDVPEGALEVRALPPSGTPWDPPELPAPPLPGENAGPTGGEPDPWIAVRAGALDVALTLDLGATLHVRLEGWAPEEAFGRHGPYFGGPVALLQPEGRDASAAAHRAAIDPDGTVRFHRLDAARTYTLWIEPVGDRSLRRTGVRAGADLRVRLEAGKTLALRIVGPAPMADVKLVLVDCPLSAPSGDPVLENGAVDLRGFPPGRYTVQASYRVDGRSYAGQVPVEAGAPRVDLAVEPQAAPVR